MHVCMHACMHERIIHVYMLSEDTNAHTRTYKYKNLRLVEQRGTAISHYPVARHALPQPHFYNVPHLQQLGTYPLRVRACVTECIACTHTHSHAHIYICMCISTYIYMNVHMSVHLCTHMYIHIHTYACICTYMHTYTLR
jgi:hypothetical protein